MTVTLDLTPTEEANLTATARQAGLEPTALLKRLVAQMAPSDALAAAPPFFAMALREKQQLSANRDRETRLVEEYHALLDCEDNGELSDAQGARLRQVEAELDSLEAQDPAERAADRRLQETGDKLDEILSLLQSLPRKDAAQ